jgi:hypothetical protein
LLSHDVPPLSSGDANRREKSLAEAPGQQTARNRLVRKNCATMHKATGFVAGVKSHSSHMSFETYTEPQLHRWLTLRALEWANFPAFVSRPIVPLLLVAYPWYFVLVGLLAAEILWCAVRYSFVSIVLARAAVFLSLVAYPAAVICAGYLFWHHRWGVGALAFLWPILASVFQLPAKVGMLELALAKRIGYAPTEA